MITKIKTMKMTMWDNFLHLYAFTAYKKWEIYLQYTH